MRKSLLFLILTYFGSTQNGSSQLHVGAGTHWHTTADTYFILDNIDFIYDSDPVLLSGIFKFTGNKDAKVGGAQTPFFNVIEVAKKGDSKLILSQTINVDEKVIFKSGLFELNNFNVMLSSFASIEGESESSRFVGSNGGIISISQLLNAPSLANPGNLGAIITSKSNLGKVIISRGHEAQLKERVKTDKGILRYYDIKPSNNANLNATLRFLYFNAELNGNNSDNVQMFKSTNPNNTSWEDHGLVSRHIANTNNYVEKTGISSFSRRTLGKPLAGALVPQVITKADLSFPAGAKAFADSKAFIIQVYPNIISGNNLYIQIGNAGVKKMQAKLFDINGRQVLSKQLPYQSQWLKLPNLSTGTYRIVLQSNKLMYSAFLIK